MDIISCNFSFDISTYFNLAFWWIYLLLVSCLPCPLPRICGCYIFCLVAVPAPHKSHQGTKQTTVFPGWMAEEPCCWLLEGDLLFVTKRLTVCFVFLCLPGDPDNNITLFGTMEQWGREGVHTAHCTLYSVLCTLPTEVCKRKHSIVEFFLYNASF